MQSTNSKYGSKSEMKCHVTFKKLFFCNFIYTIYSAVLYTALANKKHIGYNYLKCMSENLAIRWNGNKIRLSCENINKWQTSQSHTGVTPISFCFDHLELLTNLFLPQDFFQARSVSSSNDNPLLPTLHGTELQKLQLALDYCLDNALCLECFVQRCQDVS